jgi:hypothetical protein
MREARAPIGSDDGSREASASVDARDLLAHASPSKSPIIATLLRSEQPLRRPMETAHR